MRVSGWTRSKTAQLVEPPLSKKYQASAHRVGLLSTIGKRALLSVLNTREIVDGVRREELPPPAVGGCDLLSVRKPRATCPTPGQSTYRCNLPYSRAVHVQMVFMSLIMGPIAG